MPKHSTDIVRQGCLGKERKNVLVLVKDCSKQGEQSRLGYGPLAIGFLASSSGQRNLEQETTISIMQLESADFVPPLGPDTALFAFYFILLSCAFDCMIAHDLSLPCLLFRNTLMFCCYS
jgi:hypothetical protein